MRFAARFGVAFGIAAAALAFGAAAAEAQEDDGLRVEATTVYRVVPDEFAIDVEITYSITNEVPNRNEGFVVYRTFFSAITESIPADAVDVAAVRSNGAVLDVEPYDGADADEFAAADTPFRLWEIDLGPNLFFRQTRELTLTYRLLDGPARDLDAWVRVNPAFVSFVALARGDRGLASVRVEVPESFDVDTFAEGAAAPARTEDGVRVWETGGISEPFEWSVVFIGSDVDGLDRTDFVVDEVGPFAVAAWPGDDEWVAFVTDAVIAGVPLLVDAVGRPWPHDDPLQLVETVLPSLAGYAGAYYEPEEWTRDGAFVGADAVIELGEDLNAEVLNHELAHAWFNGDFSDLRWLNEGLAEYFGHAVSRASGIESPERLPFPRRTHPEAFPLRTWRFAGLATADDYGELYGYSASFHVISALAAEAGDDGMRRVVEVLAAGKNPHAPDLDSEHRLDWRVALDVFEVVGGAESAEQFFVTWVLGEDFATDELAARRRALEHRDETAANELGWLLPATIPQLLGLWDFDAAEDLLIETDAFLDEEVDVREHAAAVGVEVPEDVRAAFEALVDPGDGLDEPRRIAADQRSALDELDIAQARLADPRGFVERVGLRGLDPDADLREAFDTFEDGEYRRATAQARAAVALVEGAQQAGTDQLIEWGSAAGAALVALVLLWWVWRRRRRRKARSAAGPYDPSMPHVSPLPRRPLSGIRVVDLTIERGELAGRLLSDLGADVLRVEPPEGSPARTMHPKVGDQSLFFAVRNAGKRGVALDLSHTDDRERLHELLACSHVVIDSAEPGSWADSGFDADDLAARHPHLVVCSITSYGRTGPYAGRDVPCAVLDATGGMAFKAGVPDREPLLPPGNIADDTASMHAAFAIECALLQQHETGAGQVIDVSVNEATAQIADWSLSNWTRSLAAGTPTLDSRIGPGPVYTILPCKDGYVRLVIIAPRHWRAMRAWLGEPEYLQDPEYETFMGRFGIADAVLNPLYTELFADMTMLEVAEQCQERGIVCTPILKPGDVLANPHFAARQSFEQIELTDVSVMQASGFFEIDGARIGPTGGAPAIGEHTDDVFADLGDPLPSPEVALSSDTAPLAGLRVMDFGHGGVGVETGRMLAEYGADVVKIESRSYPDFIRVILGGEMSPSFASSSRSKRSLGVDAKTPDGVAVLKRMARTADVVIENNSTGIMDQMGIGYADLSAENPDLVMMSSQLMGSRGPWAGWSGYGPNTQVSGGMTHLWNYEGDDAPAGSMSIFPDHFAGRTGAVVSLAGVLGRRLQGDRGMHAEVCQVEQVVNVMADLLAKESADPGSVVARGNHHDRGTPWGLFPCSADDSWVAICTRSDAEWRAFVTLIGSPAWAEDADLETLAGRQAREPEIDEHVRAWTSERTVADVVDACLAARVPAGPMHNSSGQYHDPHFRERGFIVELDQPPIGTMTFEGPGFHATGMPVADIGPAPGLGAHTREVCREIGYTDAEIDALLAAGVLELDTAGED